MHGRLRAHLCIRRKQALRMEGGAEHCTMLYTVQTVYLTTHAGQSASLT